MLQDVVANPRIHWSREGAARAEKWTVERKVEDYLLAAAAKVADETTRTDASSSAEPGRGTRVRHNYDRSSAVELVELVDNLCRHDGERFEKPLCTSADVVTLADNLWSHWLSESSDQRDLFMRLCLHGSGA